jgi:hypothetical protein
VFEEREEIYQLLKIENINYHGSVNRSPVYYIFINVDDDIFQQALKKLSGHNLGHCLYCRGK